VTRRGRTTPRRAPSQARSRLTVDAVLEAAAQVFERHGYAAGTTNRIAERAGVSIGTLYQYFPNKDAILVALVEHHLADASATMAIHVEAFASDPPPPLDTGLRQLLDAFVALHADRPALHRVLFEESPRPRSVLDRIEVLERAAVGAIASWLERRPEVTAPDPEIAAAFVANALESTTHRLVIHPQPGVDPERYVAEAAVLLEAYLTAPRAAGDSAAPA
jgi:AcrR family transcriptional regulator